ncbi:hypothetical protein MTR67_000098 [Solanum verrucosum]|uniref:Uncharacterized protein n=1 Tax=Solanum verrucosum TaxID=315347 RepID=A0AAF0T727_SOLVR|nr:hypothetical protein MTR67_000098 [Solanum verrucosum]
MQILRSCRCNLRSPSTDRSSDHGPCWWSVVRHCNPSPVSSENWSSLDSRTDPRSVDQTTPNFKRPYLTYLTSKLSKLGSVGKITQRSSLRVLVEGSKREKKKRKEERIKRSSRFVCVVADFTMGLILKSQSTPNPPLKFRGWRPAPPIELGSPAPSSLSPVAPFEFV